MNVGITYDLRETYLAEGYSEEETAEFDRPSTIDAIDGALRQLGHTTDRIGHARQLIARLAAGQRWDLVFNVAEGMYGFGREAQVPAILDVYNIPYTFSDPLVLSLTLHKAMTNRVVRQLGVPTPDFAVIEEVDGVDEVDLPFPLFAKPVAEGTGKGVNASSKIRSKDELRAACARLLEEFHQPVMVETFMPGREFTVGIIGTGAKAVAVGALEVILRPGAEAGVYSYKNKEDCEELVIYKFVADPMALRAHEVALAAWRGLGCRDAGRVDLRAGADGNPRFLEVNPLAGIHPEHSDLPILCTQVGIPYIELMRRIMESALERAAKPRPAR